MRLVDEYRQKVIKETAKELNQPEEVVELVNRFQWVNAKKASKTCNQLEFPGLGIFSIKIKWLREIIVKFERILNAYKRQQATAIDEPSLVTATKKVESVEGILDNLRYRLVKIEERESKFEEHTGGS